MAGKPAAILAKRAIARWPSPVRHKADRGRQTRRGQTGELQVVNLNEVTEHMEIIGADGVHIGTVDSVEGNRIKMIKSDSGSHEDHHHYISGGLVAAVEGNQVRLSATGASAVLLEEEQSGQPLSDKE